MRYVHTDEPTNLIFYIKIFFKLPHCFPSTTSTILQFSSFSLNFFFLPKNSKLKPKHYHPISPKTFHEQSHGRKTNFYFSLLTRMRVAEENNKDGWKI
jgi:hypothetical protein